jgi:hypothetical protein
MYVYVHVHVQPGLHLAAQDQHMQPTAEKSGRWDLGRSVNAKPKSLYVRTRKKTHLRERKEASPKTG